MEAREIKIRNQGHIFKWKHNYVLKQTNQSKW